MWVIMIRILVSCLFFVWGAAVGGVVVIGGIANLDGKDTHSVIYLIL